MTLLLKIHVEGYTEAAFVSRILRPHLECYDCNIMVIINKTSNSRGIAHRGGLSHYEQFRINTCRLLKNENAVVTTMIDYYGFPAGFPGMADVEKFPTAAERVAYLEQRLDADISGDDSAGDAFIPYIQLHEFEALLFSDIAVADRVLSVGRGSKYAELRAIRTQYAPEEINTCPATAPSKRLKQLYPRYSKTAEGMAVAERTGLAVIRRNCPHFDAWLTKLERIAASRSE